MTPPLDLPKLTVDEKDALILAQASQLHAALARIEALEKQLERLLSPPKTPDNSSLPPSKGQKPNRPDKPGSKGPRQGSLGHKGGGRMLAAHPDEVVVTKPARCQCCHAAFGDEDHTLDARYDKIELPQVRPVVTRVERYSGACRGCGAVTRAAVPEGLEPGTPFSLNIMALAIYLRITHAISYRRLSDPADLINRAIEALHAAATDLPAFSTLDRLVNHLRGEAHARMYGRVAHRVTAECKAVLDALLAKPPDSVVTNFNRLKQAPGPATPKTVRLWIERLEWLDGLVNPDPLLEGIAHTKLRQFAAEAAALEVSDLHDITQPGKRDTLLLALLRQSRMRCRDELVEMMLRRIRRTQAAAKEQLEDLHDQHRATEENLIGIFGQVLETEQTQDTDAEFGRQVRLLLSEQGGAAALAEQCETVSACIAATTYRCCGPSTPSTVSCCSGCST